MTGQELRDFAEMVRRTVEKWTGFVMYGDLQEDFEGHVCLVAWEMFCETGKPLQGNRGYYFTAAERQGLLYLAQRRAVVHLTQYAVETLQRLREGWDGLDKRRGRSGKLNASAAALRWDVFGRDREDDVRIAA